MLMSTESYMDEEFEKVCAQEQYANIDYLWLFEGGKRVSLTERFVDKAAAEAAKANPPKPFTFKGDGAVLGVDQGSYSFDYDDSAYYGYDGWKVSLQPTKGVVD